MSNLLRCFGFTENRLHLGQTQTVPVWFGSRFAQSLLRCFGFTENRLRLSKAQASLALLSVCTVFRVSNSVTNRSASRTQRARFYLHSAEVKPALAAKQQQYAPSFSLSAPCILLTLTRRLRVISNAYFDTPSNPQNTLVSPSGNFARTTGNERFRTSFIKKKEVHRELNTSFWEFPDRPASNRPPAKVPCGFHRQASDRP